jgi:hypothetical protein
MLFFFSLDSFEDLHVAAAANLMEPIIDVTDIVARDELPLNVLGSQGGIKWLEYPKSFKIAQSRLVVVNALPHSMFT